MCERFVSEQHVIEMAIGHITSYSLTICAVRAILEEAPKNMQNNRTPNSLRKICPDMPSLPHSFPPRWESASQRSNSLDIKTLLAINTFFPPTEMVTSIYLTWNFCWSLRKASVVLKSISRNRAGRNWKNYFHSRIHCEWMSLFAMSLIDRFISHPRN